MFFNTKPTLSVYTDNSSTIPLRGFTLSLVDPNGKTYYIASHITTQKYLSEIREFLINPSRGYTVRYSFGHNNFEKPGLDYDPEQMDDALIDNECRVVCGLLEERNPNAIIAFRWVENKLYVSCVTERLGSTYNLREEFEDDYGLNLVGTSNEMWSINILVNDEQIRAYLDATN